MADNVIFDQSVYNNYNAMGARREAPIVRDHVTKRAHEITEGGGAFGRSA